MNSLKSATTRYHIELGILSLGIVGIFLPKPLGVLSALAVIIAALSSDAIKANTGLIRISVIYTSSLALLGLASSDTLLELTKNLEACLNIACGMMIGLAAYAMAIKSHGRANQWGILASVWMVLMIHLAMPKSYGSILVFYGLFENPNTSARTLCVVLIIALFTLINISTGSHMPKTPAAQLAGKIFKFLLRAAFILCIYLVFLTNYRSAWLGATAGITTWILTDPAGSKMKKITFLILTSLTPILLFQFADSKGFGATNNSIQSRLDLWHALLNGWINQKLWQGFGIGSFNSLDHLYSGKHVPTIYPHNAIVEVLCLSGIIGLIMILVLIYRVWTIELEAIRCHRISPATRLAISWLLAISILLLLDMKFYGTKSFALIYSCIGFLGASRLTSSITPNRTSFSK